MAMLMCARFLPDCHGGEELESLYDSERLVGHLDVAVPDATGQGLEESLCECTLWLRKPELENSRALLGWDI